MKTVHIKTNNTSETTKYIFQGGEGRTVMDEHSKSTDLC